MAMKVTASIGLAVMAVSLAFCRTGVADLQGMDEPSLEWLVDSSDAIAIGAVASAHGSPSVGYRTTRALKGHKLLRVEQTIEGSPDSGLKGDRVMLFLREKPGGLQPFRAVNFTTTLQLRVDDGKEEADSREKWQTFLAVDKKGHIISSREELIRRTEERIKSGSTVPGDCDREAVEKNKSVRGGFRIVPSVSYQLAENGKILSDVYLEILVPADPEFYEDAKRALAQPEGKDLGPFVYCHRDRVRAVLQENYRKPASGKKSDLPTKVGRTPGETTSRDPQCK
jgi:hypothetical protein